MNRRDRSNKPRLWQLEEAEETLSVAFNPKQNGSRRIASRLFILVRHASGLARRHATDPKVADGLHCTITGESDAAVHIRIGQRDSNVCKTMILAVEEIPAPRRLEQGGDTHEGGWEIAGSALISTSAVATN